MKEQYISIRPTWDILAAFQEIARLEGAQNADRQAVYRRALSYVEAARDEEVMLASRVGLRHIAVEKFPASTLKIRVEDADLQEEVRKKFARVFSLQKVQFAYLVKVTLICYLRHIQKESTEYGAAGCEGKEALATRFGSGEKKLEAPEMAKLLMEMIVSEMENKTGRDTIDYIADIMLMWRDAQ